tara:strand:+ start:676 stop:993 length:318 start_codon:yes stop_codon:yes gene_type:complete
LARGGHAHADEVPEQRDEVREAPRAVLVLPGGRHEGQEEEWHRQVGDTAAQVAPAGCGGVGDADDPLVEHLRAPGLCTHEGREREADQEAAPGSVLEGAESVTFA